MTKATRTTVNSVIFSAPVLAEGEVLTTEQRAEFVATQGNVLAELFHARGGDSKLAFDIIAAAKKALPGLVKAAEQAAADKAAAKQKENSDKAAASAAELELAKQAAEETRRVMVERLTELGMSPEQIDKHLAVMIQLPKEKTSYESVTVAYNGEQFEVKVKGNISQQAKDAIAASGLERAAFIEQYQVKAEA
jgi:hypothetical protein